VTGYIEELIKMGIVKEESKGKESSFDNTIGE
jgi:hypothetical protein